MTILDKALLKTSKEMDSYLNLEVTGMFTLIGLHCLKRNKSMFSKVLCYIGVQSKKLTCNILIIDNFVKLSPFPHTDYF